MKLGNRQDQQKTPGSAGRHQRSSSFSTATTPFWALDSSLINKSASECEINTKLRQTFAKLTPSRHTSGHKTPAKSYGDRFISTSLLENPKQKELAGYLLSASNQQSNSSWVNGSYNLSPNRVENARKISYLLNGGLTGPDAADPTKRPSILKFSTERPPLAPRGSKNINECLYGPPPPSYIKSARHILNQAERVLDAPDIVDDYYLNVLDWGDPNNILAVALSSQVLLWNPSTGTVDVLVDLQSNVDYITSLNWLKNSNYLAVGTSKCNVMLYDVEQGRCVRELKKHEGRVGSLAWNNHILSSGDKCGLINNDDVRIKDSLIKSYRGHNQEVCGLKWSLNGEYLASGGNDNILNIWPKCQDAGSSEPLHVLTEHLAAVKALAWCPWLPHVLASGGGTADRHIRFWNVHSGQCLSGHDSQSQVCSLIWNQHYKELLSAHGYPGYQLTIWKYPEMTRRGELTSHSARILHTAQSPCGEYVVSAAADETIRIWHCFKMDKSKIIGKSKISKTSSIGGQKISNAGRIVSSLR